MPAAIGGVFLTAAFAATSTGVIVAGIIGGALIGAAIGGISAAVMGGDIGKGMLFGAVGGAVLGGIGAWAAPSSTATSATTSVGMGENVVGAAATKGTAMSAYGTTAGSTMAGGGGILGGLGQSTGAALVTTGGQMLMGTFSGEGELTEKDKAQMEQTDRLAKLQAETQTKIAAMKGGGGGGSGDARYAADLQLLNAREQRQQDYKMKNEEYSAIEEARARRQGAVANVQAGVEGGAVPEGAQSIDQQVYKDSTQMYAAQAPAPVQNITPAGGVLRPEIVNA